MEHCPTKPKTYMIFRLIYLNARIKIDIFLIVIYMCEIYIILYYIM
jgi:hypothetical protein